MRSLVSVPAGLLKMSFRRFLLASTLGTAVWTALLAGAGYKLGENYTDIDKIARPGRQRDPGRRWYRWLHLSRLDPSASCRSRKPSKP